MGLILLFYAAGIWRMRRYAMMLGWLYAAYVIVNLVLYTRLNPPARNSGEMIFGIVYMILAIVITVGTAIILTRRRTELAGRARPLRSKINSGTWLAIFGSIARIRLPRFFLIAVSRTRPS